VLPLQFINDENFESLGLTGTESFEITGITDGLEPRDPATLVGATAVLATVGALAAWLPARRASRIDPAAVLRNE